MQNTSYPTGTPEQNEFSSREWAKRGGKYGSKHGSVCWGSIFAGAMAIISMTMLLVLFGSGIGLSSVSPWAHEGMKAETFTAFAAIWLIIVQWVSAGLGGYITGRMRYHSKNIHAHESYFRDTVHGFLAWGVAALLMFVTIASAASHVMHAGSEMAAARGELTPNPPSAMPEPMHGAAGGPFAYYVDRLYRSDKADVAVADQDTRAETTRVLMRNLKNDDMDAGDKAYLSQLVATKTGLSQPDAAKRIDEVVSEEKVDEVKVKSAADEARKATAKITFYTFFSMLVGAFIASAAGALGGHHREDVCQLAEANPTNK